MFRRLRQTKISLAAKCQLLFGAAVILIIFAALCVPWQRMDQLTGQLNQKAAQAVIRNTLADHITVQRRLRLSPASQSSIYAATRPMAPSVVPSTIDGEAFVAPHLVGVASLNHPGVTRFENAALVR
ncbi:MAG: hypothetical protein JO353_00890, partial [Phycisphaerae bacterium]|nr:hypothetical protein [Phycisphaerae bacterium]